MDENTHEKSETHDLRQIFSPEFTFTKRQIGILLLIGGLVGFVGILAIDIVRGDNSGIGPAQMLGLVLMIISAVFGATLIPLGKQPV